MSYTPRSDTDSRYVNASGDTMSGQLDNSAAYAINLSHPEGSIRLNGSGNPGLIWSATNFWIAYWQGRLGCYDTGTGAVRPFAVANPTAADHAATKEYVDGKVGGGGGVIVCESVADRNTKIPTPTAGMMCYLKDTGTYQTHNGYTWVGDTGWTQMVGNPSWTNWNSEALYRMDAFGVVELKTHFTKAAGGTNVMTTLPSNYKPAVNGVAMFGGWLLQPGKAVAYFGVNPSNYGVNVEGYSNWSGLIEVSGHGQYQADYLAIR